MDHIQVEMNGAYIAIKGGAGALGSLSPQQAEQLAERLRQLARQARRLVIPQPEGCVMIWEVGEKGEMLSSYSAEAFEEREQGVSQT